MTTQSAFGCLSARLSELPWNDLPLNIIASVQGVGGEYTVNLGPSSEAKPDLQKTYPTQKPQ